MAILALLLLSAVTSQNSIFSNAVAVFVRPSENVTCPSQPCLTLNDYAREPGQYFLDNSTFLFLPGIHHLDYQLRVENVSNVNFFVFNEEKDNTVKVFLSPLVTIIWMNCNNIEISNLVFVPHSLIAVRTSFSALLFYKTSGFLSKLTLFGNGVIIIAISFR